MIRKQNDNQIDEAQMPRRKLFLKMWLGLAAVAFAELIWVVWSFLKDRRSSIPSGVFGTVMAVGSVAGFLPNSVTAFPRGHFYLARLANGGFLAIHRRCTHLGCTVPWNEEKKQFECPCHSSTFNIKGEVLQSPAPRALDIFPITIENNVIYVNTGRLIKRSGFRVDQVISAR